jgi:hypothetical protein
MTLLRTGLQTGLIVVAALMASLMQAAAQTQPWPGQAPPPAQAWPQQQQAPAGFPQQAAPPPAFPQQQQQQQPPPCIQEFIGLRQDAEKRALAIKSAAEKKVPPQEACKLFSNFAAAEAKMIKYAEGPGAACGIPASAVSQMKQSHDRTNKIKGNVCNAAAAGAAGAPGRPAAPSLSDALGTSSAPIPEANSTRGRTFDTMTGNALAPRPGTAPAPR